MEDNCQKIIALNVPIKLYHTSLTAKVRIKDTVSICGKKREENSMAKDKPKNGRRTVKPGRARPPGPQHKPTGKKDPGGFKSPGFKSEGFTSGGRKVKTGPPPSVRARDEKRAKQPPPVKYGGKKRPIPPGMMEIPPGWLKPKPGPRPKPKPKPKPRPEPRPPKRPRPPPDWKPKPLPKWPIEPPKYKPKPRPKTPPKPKPRKPKKPMNKGRPK